MVKKIFLDQVDRKIVVEINFRKHLFLFLAIEIIYATLSYDLLYYLTYFLFKISRSDMKMNVYLGIIGMIVDPGLVTDGSANDAIPPTRGF